MKIPEGTMAGLEVWRIGARQTGGSTDGSSTSSLPSSTLAAISISIVVVLIVVAAAGTWYTIRSKKKSYARPGYLPGDNMLSRVRTWTGRTNSRGEYGTQLQPAEYSPSLIRPDQERGRSRLNSGAPSQENLQNVITGSTEAGPEQIEEHAISSGAGVDRRTSVRSVMTLPVYSETVGDSEQILAREGERAGMDSVVEWPEDDDDEEARRNEEMESLYQIRRARRQEQQAREERRRVRREARQTNDFATLQRLHEEARTRSDDILQSQILIAQHQSADRQRRVSSVQYAELGVARHDGSRIRANSTDSDNRPLLDSAASIAGLSLHPVSTNSSTGRGRSSSVLSISTNASDDTHSPGRTISGTHASNVGSDFEIVSLDHNDRSRASSMSRVDPPSISIASNSGEAPPPDYNNLAWGEAPPYESPVRTRGPQLPVLPSLSTNMAVPAIEISAATPLSAQRSGSVDGGDVSLPR